MVKIKWSDFLNPEKKIAINCQTEEDTKEFLQMLDARGLMWYDGTTFFRISPTPDDSSRSYSSYKLTEDNKQRISIGSKDYFERENFTIYRYSEVEFMDEEQEKQEHLTLKEEALYNIVKAMAEIRCNLEETADYADVFTNATAMKLLAEAFDIASKA